MAKRKMTNNDLQITTQKTKELPTQLKNQGWTHVHRKGRQWLDYMCNPSCYSCYKPGDNSWM